MPTKKSKAKKIRVADIVAKPVPIRIRKNDEIEDVGINPLLETQAEPEEEGESEEAMSFEEPIDEPEPTAIHGSHYVHREHIKEPDIISKINNFEEREMRRFRDEESQKRHRQGRLGFKTFVILLILFVLLGGSAYAAVTYLPKAQIKILVKKSEWQLASTTIFASKKVSTVDVLNRIIPAELFSSRKNFTFSYPATGKKQMTRKAEGTITIYNTYSTAPQKLVINTRLADPNGKIFHLVAGVTVPGATMSGGNLVPSSIDAAVTADKAGPEYNIPATNKFTIPGLAGSPKYNGFYGISTLPMQGGVIGEAAYPTPTDISKNKPIAEKSLRDTIGTYLYGGISPDFRIINGSEAYSIIKEVVSPIADQNGNFNIFMDAELTVVAFRDSDFLALMTALANRDLMSGATTSEVFAIKEYKTDYGVGEPDIKQGQLAFVPSFTGTFWQPVDSKSFEKSALSKSQASLKAIIDSFANVDKVTISFWPFWVKSVPSNPERVEVQVE